MYWWKHLSLIDKFTFYHLWFTETTKLVMKDDSKNIPVEDDQNNYVDTLNGTRKDIGLKLNSSFVKFFKGFVINGALIVAAVLYSPHRWKTCTFAFSLLRQKGIVALTIVLTFLLVSILSLNTYIR